MLSSPNTCNDTLTCDFLVFLREFESNFTGLKSLESFNCSLPGDQTFGPSLSDVFLRCDESKMSSLLDHFAETKPCISDESFFFILTLFICQTDLLP